MNWYHSKIFPYDSIVNFIFVKHNVLTAPKLHEQWVLHAKVLYHIQLDYIPNCSNAHPATKQHYGSFYKLILQVRFAIDSFLPPLYVSTNKYQCEWKHRDTVGSFNREKSCLYFIHRLAVARMRPCAPTPIFIYRFLPTTSI